MCRSKRTALLRQSLDPMSSGCSPCIIQTAAVGRFFPVIPRRRFSFAGFSHLQKTSLSVRYPASEDTVLCLTRLPTRTGVSPLLTVAEIQRGFSPHSVSQTWKIFISTIILSILLFQFNRNHKIFLFFLRRFHNLFDLLHALAQRFVAYLND